MTDRELLAETIEREAGNQPFIGKVAVGMVILERVKDRRWPDTIRGVILQPMQFSCWNFHDPDREPVSMSQDSWAAVDLCLSGLVAPTGYNHYWNPKLCNPSWAASLKERIAVGDHVFGKMV